MGQWSRLTDLDRAPLTAALERRTVVQGMLRGTIHIVSHADYWPDATLLVHARRAQTLPERHRSRLFNTKTPHPVPTFLVDGQVAGTWCHEQGRILAELSRAALRQVDEEAERLAAFHA